jgi:peroxiredoxin
VLAALFFVGSLWLFIHVRDVPRSAGAPQVGQRVPDFTLPDSTDQPVSLAQLFSAAPGTALIPRYHLLHKAGGLEGHDISRPAEFLVDRSGRVRRENFAEDIRARPRAEKMLAAARAIQW